MLKLLQQALDSDISLWVEGEDIELSFGDEAPAESFIDSLRQEKPALLAFLNEKEIFSEEAFEQFLSVDAMESGDADLDASFLADELLTDGLSFNDSMGIEAIFPATSLQQGFVYHHLSQPQDDAYRVQLLLDYHHSLDIPLYQKAWRMASKSFPILRTAFDWDGEGDILQVVSQAPSIDESHFDYLDLSSFSQTEQEERIQQLLSTDRKQGFDLSQPGLLRFVIIKLGVELYTVLKTEHHIISDGWSSAILLQNVHQYYADLVDGKTPQPVVETAYLDAQSYYAKHTNEIHRYWEQAKKNFGETNDINPLLSHPCDLNQIKTIEQATETTHIIKGATYHALKECCRQLGVTLSVAVQFAWHKLLHLHTQDEQTIVGTTVSGRDIPVEGIETSVGLYINTLPLVVDWHDDRNVEQILLNIHQSSADLNSYSNIPLASLQQEGERLFHSLFVFENFPMAEETIGSGNGQANIVSFRQSVGKVDYPLSLTVYDQNESLMLKLEYGEEWLTHEKAMALLAKIEKVLQAVPQSTQRPHYDIDLLSDEERNRQLALWNQTELPVTGTGLHHAFEQHAKENPGDIALNFESKQWSYLELNHRANQLARLIQQKHQEGSNNDSQLDDNKLIALYLRPGPDMIVSVLAALKSGSAYVPISPEFPSERIQFILEDTQASLVISQQDLLTPLNDSLIESETKPQVVSIDSSKIKDQVEKQNSDNLSLPVDGSQLAYVLYTSGTTGKPKGVLIEHRNLINLMHGLDDALAPRKRLVTLGVTSFVFDIFVLELFFTLTKGGTLVIASEQQRQSPAELISIIQEHQVTLVQLTPSRLQLLLSETDIPQIFAKVECLILGGEAFPQQHLAQLQSLPNLKTFNGYGPTEASVYATMKNLSHEERVTLGKPIANSQFYVLDKAQKLLPEGCRGELYISGSGLGRGYLNRPELTAERFIENPFVDEQTATAATQRLYRTGDVVRWLPNGELEYLGRSDFQVKIRGYRIELGEVEHALCRLSSVKQCVVINKEHNGSQYLAAYVVPNKEGFSQAEGSHRAEGSRQAEGSFDADALLNELSKVLPEYMIPSSLMCLDAIPITVNGKLDRKALPQPLFESQLTYLAPTTEFERQLCEVWQEVLGLEQVGINDNFFRIGGNSILAIQLTAAIRNKLEVDIPLAVLLEQRTVKGIADKYQAVEVISKTELSPYPLSFSQERMLFLQRFDEGSSAYHIPYFVQLKEDVNLDALAKAFEKVVERHPILRTVYRQNDLGQEEQQLLNYKAELSAIALDNADAFKSKVLEDIYQPFDLTCEASIRTKVYSQNHKQYLLIIWHHIAFDGWSTSIFMQELGQAYQELILVQEAQGQETEWQQSDIRYVDFAAWQRERLQGELFEELNDYWLQQLSDYETLTLPTDHPRPENVSFEGSNFLFEVDEALSTRLKSLAKHHETTLYTVMLSAFYLLLAKLSGQQNIILGTPSDNRRHPQTQGLIGLFVNSLALRTDVESSVCLTDFIHQVHELVKQAKIHEELPFERLLEVLKVERDTSRHPLFQVMFSMAIENTMVDIQAGLPFESIDLDEETDLYTPAKFDIDLSLSDQGGIIAGTMNYATQLFERDSVARIVKMYLTVLAAMAEDTQQCVSDIDLISEAERERLLYQFNQTDKNFPQTDLLHRLFEQQAQLKGQQVALIYKDKQLTYQEVDEAANQIASHIRKQYQALYHTAMPTGTFIALYLDRSLETFVSILAVLKAGAAYAPISPEYPQDRTQFILTDTQTPLVLTQHQYLADLDSWVSGLEQPAGLLAVDTLVAGTEKVQGITSTKTTVEPNDLAYMIYTSGTTGKPKGVMIEHQAIVSRYFGWQELYLKGKEPTVLNMADYGFDVATADWIRALCSGGQLVVCPKETLLDAPALIELIEKHNVNLADFVPATLRSLTDYVSHQQRKMPSIDHLIVGSDVWNMNDHFKAQQSLDSNTRLYNAYGVTECAVDSSCYYVAPEQLQPSVQSIIGQPLANVRAYVLNEAMQCQPLGTPGELYIGGAGLARGYFNRSDLTDSRFVANPFATLEDKKRGWDRLYRTGDLVRWLPDGNLEFLGRNDFQVKIRGYRIELGEIEHALMQLSSVKQAVVIDREKDGRKYLAAYVVSTTGIDITQDSLREQIVDSLPEYMIPSTFTVLHKIPLTVNGKLDRRQLPEPQWTEAEDYVAPRSATETTLCEIWQEVLGLEKVSIRDNFFHIGGDSILSLQVVSRANAAQINLTTRMIFESSTIEKLALQASSVRRSISQESSEGQLSLLPIQQDFLMTEMKASGDFDALTLGHFHQSLLTRVPEPFDIEFLKLFVRALYRRHDVFRLQFSIKPSKEWQAEYLPVSDSVADKSVQVYQMQSEDYASEIEQVGEAEKASFDIQSGPLFKMVYLVGVKPEQSRLLWIAHHLVVDGVSWRILMADLIRAYTQYLAEEPVQLLDKTTSYQDWSRKLLDYSRSDTLKEEKAYWLESLKQSVQPIREDNQNVTDNHWSLSQSIEATLDEKHTQLLLSQCNTVYQTQVNELLLSALFLACHRWQGHTSLRIAMEGHGREDIFDDVDLSETVGWFTSIYPLTLRYEQSEATLSLADLITRIKQQVRTIPAKGLGYGLLRYLAKDRDIVAVEAEAHTDILFNYLGQFDDNNSQKSSEKGSEGAFEVTRESSGSDTGAKIQRTHKLSLNALVMNKKLSINLEFNNKQFELDSMQGFADMLITSLQEVVQHCEQKLSPYYVSDLPHGILEQATSNRDQFESLIRFNQNGHHDPVFAVPPAGAGAEAYYQLVKQLDPETPITVCENIELYTNALYSLPSLADYYAQLIISTKPSQPVYLMGASRGAILVQALATILEANAIDVKGVFFLDPIGYTMAPECMQQIEQDTRVSSFSTEQRDILNHTLHLFDYTRRLKVYSGDGIVFQSEADMPKSGDWSYVESMIEEYYQFYGEREALPKLSYGLGAIFPNCKAVHLDGDHGQLLGPLNLAVLAEEINQFIKRK
ncbi:non-ribosomal peptide synthetase [Pleionea sp. CnH1-48]|uniref:non-ribosomal peptide synthetase n=1 Tax=Pleionea sp. CnH1-48 TaxID=2954494 RepID=UPI002097C6FC|nr:non-ribosomal peptide synthetase [Pleionea sp. CnH1-48]MCO7224350.1 amino acid adenylation domain-containing protein [Pleionea sp. CnH1-48]